MMITNVEDYFLSGCGRCKHFNTPNCKVHKWDIELFELRKIILKSQLKETTKWGMPVYTLNDKNVLAIAAFKEYCCISFFKGPLLNDEFNLLEAPGENSKTFRQIRITKSATVKSLQKKIEAYIKQAISIEQAGVKLEKPANNEPLPVELLEVFKKKKPVHKAFLSLTPGRQRGYILFFNQAKQTATKISRIEKAIPSILAGKGMHD
jgi:uncharacterized protein YdeI (YjbR/CyaY-like superfamily)